MEVQVEPASVEKSHDCTKPVYPLSVNVPLFTPVQTVALPETEPPTDGGSTVIIAGVEKAETFVEGGDNKTSALYQVVVVRFA